MMWFVAGVALLLLLALLRMMKPGKLVEGVPQHRDNKRFTGMLGALQKVNENYDTSFNLLLDDELKRNGGKNYTWNLLGGMSSYVFYRPEETEFILKDNYETILRRDLDDYFGVLFQGGIISAEGSEWKRHRALCTRILARRVLNERMSTCFGHSAHRLVSWVLEHGSDGVVNLKDIVSNTAFDNVTCIAINRDFNVSQNPRDKELQEALTELQFLGMLRYANPFWRLCRMLQLTENERRFTRLSEVVRGYIDEVVEEYIDDDGMPVPEKVAGDPTICGIYLQDAIGTKVDRLELRGTLTTFVQAGSDTTASSITTTLYFLSKNPVWQERVIEEARRVFGDASDDILTYGDVHGNTPVAQACFLESMRLYPALGLMLREITEDLVFPGNVKVSKGVRTGLSIGAANTNKEVWGGNAEEFDPSRWLDKQHPWYQGTEKKIEIVTEYMYPVFSAGPRKCIGSNIAMLEAQIILATFFRKLRIKLVEEPKRVVGVLVGFQDLRVTYEKLD